MSADRETYIAQALEVGLDAAWGVVSWKLSGVGGNALTMERVVLTGAYDWSGGATSELFTTPWELRWFEGAQRLAEALAPGAAALMARTRWTLDASRGRPLRLELRVGGG